MSNRYYTIKRKHPRFNVTIKADIYLAESSILQGKGIVIDISLGGLCIESTAELHLYSTLIIHLKLDPEIFTFEGEILRKEQKGPVFSYGVKYKGLNLFAKFKLKKRIENWVKSYGRTNPPAKTE